MSFTINNKLSFIDSFQFLIFSLDSLVKNLSKDDLKYLNQEFDKTKLDLVKQRRFYPQEYMTDFEKFTEKLPNKEMFHSSLTGKEIVTKNMIMFSMIGINLERKQQNIINICTKSVTFYY